MGAVDPAGSADRTWATTGAEIALDPVYGPEHVPSDLATRLGVPGAPPFARGITADGYRTAPWIMGQYGGFGTAQETNQRFRELIAAGQTGFSVALDLPTQMGLDSDHPLALGEVGKVGVAIDSLADMEVLFDGIDLGAVRQIRTTANAIGHIWLALVVAVCRRRGIDPGGIRILIQNDVLKEYFARGTYIHAPAAGLSIVADVIEHCAEHLPAWTPVTISGYHIREAGSDPVEEVAFSFANGIAYCEAAMARGLEVDRFASSLFTFLSANMDLLEEVAKFRAARRVWDRIMSERLGARLPESRALRIFAFTAGSRLTAQRPLNNVARTTIEALAAVLGGAQTLHVSAYDEALGVPTAEAALTALHTQQIILHETSLTAVADPLGGSWYVEHLTDELERRMLATLAEIDAEGGALACIESGWFHRRIEDGAYRQQRDLDRGVRRVVGLDEAEGAGELRVFQPDPASEQRQREAVARVRAERDAAAVTGALDRLVADARAGRNIVPATIEAVEALATVGEITEALASVHGRYRPGLVG
jgi:methylmalonyl-CoA mutase N-terminal domain/subunit